MFDEEDGHLYNSTLSYFARPNVTTTTTEFHGSQEERTAARERVAEKKAKLQELLTGIKPKKKKGLEKGNSDIEAVADPETTPKKKKKKKKEEESEPDSSEVEFGAESEEVPDDEATARVKQLFWEAKAKSRKYDKQFDTYYNLDEQMEEYEKIKGIFKDRNIKLVDEKKNPFNLKNAIFMYQGLDVLPESRLKELRTQTDRYAPRGEGLMIDPFAWDVPKDKKKKKK